MKPRGKWKQVEIDTNRFSQDDLKEFVGLEELTDYELVQDNCLHKSTNKVLRFMNSTSHIIAQQHASNVNM